MLQALHVFVIQRVEKKQVYRIRREKFKDAKVSLN